MRILVPLGRALFAMIFIMAVIGHFSGSMIDYASAHGVPLATLLVPLSGLLAFTGGIMVLLGYRARFGALLLLCFLVPVTLVMHDFWNITDAAAKATQRAAFMKNLALMGGAVLLMHFGSGPYSLDD